MKQWESLTAAFCAAVLLCGLPTIPTFAYANGGEDENYSDPTMTKETTVPEPEPTTGPDKGFSEEGNLVTRGLLYDKHTNKQSITVQTAGGNAFYIVIDYDKSVDEEGEQYKTCFLNMTDEADLLTATEATGVEQATRSCSEGCAAGVISTDCPVCAVNMTGCTGVEPEPMKVEETGEPVPEKDEPETGGNMEMLLLALAVAMIGDGADWYFGIYRPKRGEAAKSEEDYSGELDGYNGGKPYGDEEDDGPPWNEEGDDGEEVDK